MRILRANHLGMCFGVRDAIALAESHAKTEPLTILGDIVHNESVVKRLKDQGVQIETDLSKVKNRTAMITAHGASDQAMARARSHGLHLLEGTCPLVKFAHGSVSRLVREGYYPVIIGKRGHVEVQGLTEDLVEFDIIENATDIDHLKPRPRFGIASQTTQPIDRVRHLVELMRQKFPTAEVRFVDTVCQPTKQRQKAALDLASQCDTVVVVGGRNSNNTRELVQTCSRKCSRVHHVHQPSDLQSEWFHETKTVGITAGTSTPDDLIDSVEDAIRNLAATMAEHCRQ